MLFDQSPLISHSYSSPFPSISLLFKFFFLSDPPYVIRIACLSMGRWGTNKSLAKIFSHSVDYFFMLESILQKKRLLTLEVQLTDGDGLCSCC